MFLSVEGGIAEGYRKTPVEGDARCEEGQPAEGAPFHASETASEGVPVPRTEAAVPRVKRDREYLTHEEQAAMDDHVLCALASLSGCKGTPSAINRVLERNGVAPGFASGNRQQKCRIRLVKQGYVAAGSGSWILLKDGQERVDQVMGQYGWKRTREGVLAHLGAEEEFHP